MASRISLPRADVGAALRAAARQFRGLDPNDPSRWPAVPRYALCAVVAAAVVVVLWFVWLGGVDEEYQADLGREQSLREDYRTKVARAVNLEQLKKQR